MNTASLFPYYHLTVMVKGAQTQPDKFDSLAEENGIAVQQMWFRWCMNKAQLSIDMAPSDSNYYSTCRGPCFRTTIMEFFLVLYLIFILDMFFISQHVVKHVGHMSAPDWGFGSISIFCIVLINSIFCSYYFLCC